VAADVAAQLVPWAALLGFLGLVLKLRVSGDPALWKRIEALEAKIDQQRKDFEKVMREEREDCARRLLEMEGRIRQLQQRQTSAGNVADKPLAGPLRQAFPPIDSDQDADLMERLDRVPSPRKRRK
jgi:hypothetical protein